MFWLLIVGISRMLEWKLDWGRSDSAPQELFRTLSPNQIQETKLDWIKDTRLLAGLYSRTIKSTNNDSKTSRASLHFLFFSEKVNWSLRTTKRLHRTITHLHMMVHLLLEETVNIMCTNLYFRALKSKQARFSMQIELPAKVLDYFSWSNNNNII